MATYRDAAVPDLTHVELEIELFPDRGRYRASGTYDLAGPADRPYARFCSQPVPTGKTSPGRLTTSPPRPLIEQDFMCSAPDQPLGKDRCVRIGFRHEAAVPRGISKRGGDAMEFIVPSGAVLTSLSEHRAGPGLCRRTRSQRRQSIRRQGIRAWLLPRAD